MNRNDTVKPVENKFAKKKKDHIHKIRVVDRWKNANKFNKYVSLD